MKKNYITPAMKVKEISPEYILSESVSIGDVSQGSSYHDAANDYIQGDSGDGYDYGEPD